MRMRNPKNKDQILESCNFFYQDVPFDNANPIHLEIGMGKGDFLLNMALKHPDINFIGVEKYSSVISYAIKKIQLYEISNLRIINDDALNLKDILKDKIELIYLNFSDPWPKKRHAKRRLTSDVFLQIYDQLFKNKPHIIMKTDNDDLFAYSLQTLEDYGYIFKRIEYDLHNTNIDNVLTEYETKFSQEGIKIKYFEAFKE
ncbi:MAG: tRNA (guanosine(46)-N7)-methyltransferase TrmB [Firmicutes bacterium]|nr:tRNA (guanosine(46)-N7)-methyltransferase TrmB [Bacillota bacterium]